VQCRQRFGDVVLRSQVVDESCRRIEQSVHQVGWDADQYCITITKSIWNMAVLLMHYLAKHRNKKITSLHSNVVFLLLQSQLLLHLFNFVDRQVVTHIHTAVDSLNLVIN